jgi:tRNA C32,U32 (ribose-2'-O)-methylase TrmJ
MERLRRLFSRASLEKEEVSILRGILSRWEKPRGEKPRGENPLAADSKQDSNPDSK